MKFIGLDPKVIVQGNSGRLYEIRSSDPPSMACSKCCFIRWEGYKNKRNYCDSAKVTKEFDQVFHIRSYYVRESN